MGIDSVNLGNPPRTVPEILLKVKGLLVSVDSTMPQIPKGCENALGVSVKQTWAERGTWTTAAGILLGSSKLTNQKGYFRYDNASTQAFISIYEPKNYCVVTLEVDMGNKIWQNNMESCGASKANQDPFMTKELSKYSSCYMYKDGVCQCWPSFITPISRFQPCVERFIVDDPLKYCMRLDPTNLEKCELCIMGTTLWKGLEGQEDRSLGKCVFMEKPGQYFPISTCSQRDEAGRYVRDEGCYACHCSGDCDSACNQRVGVCTNVCDICNGEQEELMQDLSVSELDLVPRESGRCYCPSGNDYRVGV